MLKSTAAFFSAATLSVGLAVAAPGGAQGVDDETLQKFVASAQEVAMISQEYSQTLQTAESQEQQQAIVQEANEKMVDAVQSHGLTVAEFNGINDAIEQDPALAERAQQLAQ